MIFTVFALFCLLQSPTEKVYSVHYQGTIKGILLKDYVEGRGVLNVSENESYYYLPDFYKETYYPESKGKIINNVNHFAYPTYGDEEGMPIYRNYKKDSVWYVPNYRNAHNHFILKEPSVPIDWQITGETKTLLGYPCYKATGEYYGRSYIAWFTPEIPIPAGPYQYWGCPGLILQVYSTDGKVDYMAEEIHEKRRSEVKIQVPNHVPIYNMEQYKAKCWENEMRIRIEIPMAKNLDPPNDVYIENGKWTIRTEFNAWWDGNER